MTDNCDGSDKLILSLSHAPLPTTLLDSLLDRASSECNVLLDSIAQYTQKVQLQELNEKQQSDHHHDEKKIESMEIASLPKKQKQNSCDSNKNKGNVILHVLATGTPYVIKPGKSQPDYIQQWTKGERILARLVDKIGMEKFHRVPKDGETKLAGRLIDVKPSDFEFILSHSSRNKNNDSEECGGGDGEWKDDCLMEEMTWIAKNILRILIIDKRPNIGTAKIIFPLDPRFEKVKEDDIHSFIQGIFEKEWSGTQGPLYGAHVEVLVVKK